MGFLISLIIVTIRVPIGLLVTVVVLAWDLIIMLPLFIISFIFLGIFGNKRAIDKLGNDFGNSLGMNWIGSAWGWVFDPQSGGDS
jgi:ABC-type sulfate transport system permease component